MEKVSRNYRFFQRNFTSLSKRHGGGVVVIAGGRLVGTCRRTDHRTVSRLVARARAEHPNEAPFVAPIPSSKELATPLLI